MSTRGVDCPLAVGGVTGVGKEVECPVAVHGGKEVDDGKDQDGGKEVDDEADSS